MHKMPNDETPHWYAMRVYHNRSKMLTETLSDDGIEYFDPSEAIASLLFVHCDEHYIADLGSRYFDRVWIYRRTGSRVPAVVPDREMEVFRFVVTAGKQGLTFLGDDRPEYHQGDRVVVTDGPFKGAEGHIKRIKRDRRLIVSIDGVVAVATTYIHPKFLKKVDMPEPTGRFRI